MDVIIRAQKMAKKAHKGQKIKWSGLPYIIHPARVAMLVESLRATSRLSVTGDMVSAAWLHDVVEDSDLTVEDIRQEFGDDVALWVGELTNPVYDGLSRQERNEMDFARLAIASNEAKVIKLADRIDNLGGVLSCSSNEKALRYLEESRLLLEALGGAQERLESQLYRFIQIGLTEIG